MFSILVVIFLTGSSRASCDHKLLARCAVQILNANNSMRTTVYVTISNQVSDDLRASILSSAHENHRPMLLLNGFKTEFFNPNKPILPRAYLVVAHDARDLATYLGLVNVTAASWRPEVDFVVVLETLMIDHMLDVLLEPVFQRFWSYYTLRSVLLVPTEHNDRVDALAWFPFLNRCGSYHRPNTVDTCYGGHWTAASDTDVFGGRVPKVFANCKVKVAGFNWPPMTILSNHTPRRMVAGMDVELVKMMARAARLRLELVEIEHDQRWGVKSADGTWNGGFGQLSLHGADLLIGGGIMTAERMMMFDSAPARQVIRFPLYTPPPQRLPHWRTVANVFAADLWCAVAAAYAAVTALLRTVDGRAARPAYRGSWARSAVATWSALCGVPAAGPQPRSGPARAVFVSWAVYALHVGAVYTSVQLVCLYRPRYGPRMSTVADVRRSGLPVCCVPTFIPIGQSMTRENFNLTGFTACTDMAASMSRLLLNKDLVVLDPEDHFETLIASALKRVNRVDELVIVYNVGVYTQKGSPYAAALRRAQIVAYEAGLHGRWRADASPRLPLNKDGHVRLKKLNVDELQGAFVVLLAGLLVSTVAFLCERCVGAASRA